MTLRLSTRSKMVVAALAVVAVAMLSGGQAQASNMGFKHNHVIFKNTGGGSIGNNFVALPYHNPYNSGQDICTALNLTTAGAKLQQINAATGAINSCPCAASGCTGLTLLQNATAPPAAKCPAPGTNNKGFNGILVTTPPPDTGGIIVGSHSAGSVCLPSTTGGGSLGVNYFPVPYHTTAVSAQDLCTQAGIGATGKVSRTNAQSGSIQTCPCGGCAALTLVLGEAVTITDASNHVFAPSHF